jgi:tetratricopeptide (TPR) repeat protein
MAKLCPEYKFEQAVNLLLENPEEALPVWQDLAKRYPSDHDVRVNYGVCLLQTGHYDQAILQLEMTTRKKADIEGLTALLQAYGSASMPNHGLKIARKLRDRGGLDLVDQIEAELAGAPEIENLSESFRLEFERCQFNIRLKPNLQSLKNIENLAAKSNGFVPAYNNVVTAAIELMDWEKALSASQTVLALAPDNVHALYSRVRLEYLTTGQKAARVWLERVRKAPVGKATQIYESEATQAQTLALLGDKAGVQKAVKAYLQRHKKLVEPSPLFEMLIESLELQKHQPQRPLLELHHFLPRSLIERWKSLNAKQLFKTAAADLQAMPGVLEYLRDHLIFQDGTLLNLFAMVLIDNTDVPVPNSSSNWTDIFKGALKASLDPETKLVLSQVFKQKELLNDQEITDLSGEEFQQFELHNQTMPSPFSEAEYKQHEKALKLLHENKFQAARALLEPLVAKYPDRATDKHNLALTYLYDNDGEARAEAMFLEIYKAHPNYLFSKAELARLAIKRNDLSAAKEFLIFPKNLGRVHIMEYTTFLLVMGILAHAEGDLTRAKTILKNIAEIDDEDSPAYISLDRLLNPIDPKNLWKRFEHLMGKNKSRRKS